jgi:hypothetical protein
MTSVEDAAARDDDAWIYPSLTLERGRDYVRSPPDYESFKRRRCQSGSASPGAH